MHPDLLKLALWRSMSQRPSTYPLVKDRPSKKKASCGCKAPGPSTCKILFLSAERLRSRIYTGLQVDEIA